MTDIRFGVIMIQKKLLISDLKVFKMTVFLFCLETGINIILPEGEGIFLWRRELTSSMKRAIFVKTERICMPFSRCFDYNVLKAKAWNIPEQGSILCFFIKKNANSAEQFLLRRDIAGKDRKYWIYLTYILIYFQGWMTVRRQRKKRCSCWIVRQTREYAEYLRHRMILIVIRTTALRGSEVCAEKCKIWLRKKG